MQELWSSASYEPHLMSLLFAFAPAAILVVIAYALVMRGEPVLRAWLLMHFVTLLPLFVTITLAPSTVSPEASTQAFRIATACLPLTAVGGGAFQFSLIGMHKKTRWFTLGFLVIALVWLVVGSTTDAIVGGVRWLPAGMWFATPGTHAWLSFGCVIASTLPSYIALANAALRSKPSIERRQLRIVLVANLITYTALPVDVGLAYGIGVFPMSWLLAGIGSVLVARALVVEDLLRARAVDTTAPQLVLHLAMAILLGWVALEVVGDVVPWWVSALVLMVAFASVRVIIATSALINRGARERSGTLDRLLGQLVARARPLESESQIAQLAIDVVDLGLGVRPDVLIAGSEDYGWSKASGEKLPDDAAPDPLLGAWLGEHRRALFVDELELHVPDDLRDSLAALFERHHAREIIPVSSDGELLALMILPGKRVRGRELAFVERAAERFAEALVHARMRQRAAQRALLARQVELAATVQAQLLPAKGPHVHGDITVVGSWLPASRCAGDFWGVYPLGDTRVLVAIGDVTGHGVPSSMVTAGAAAAVDVMVRRYGNALELTDLIAALDTAVRRVGGGQLAMTCFAAILDPDAREVRFISCGHTTPYLVRQGEVPEELELQALVGRGNPLGGGGSVGAKVLQKPLKAGDLLVWYTDGVLEARDGAGEPFGDRRLQRMLRRLERASFTAPAVHDALYASIAAHRAGRPREDDETLVVAHWQPGRVSSTDLVKESR